MSKNQPVDAVVSRIRGERGLSVKVAAACGVARQAVYQWKRVPPEHVQAVSGVINEPPETIRPDIFKGAKKWRSSGPKKG